MPTCAADQLTLTVGDSDGAAGHEYTQLILTNTGTTQCSLDGHPGVSFIDGSGRQLGPSAIRVSVGTETEPEATPTVVLDPGAAASALMVAEHAGFATPCTDQQESAAIKVYPPDDTGFLTVPFVVAVCTDPPVTSDSAPLTITQVVAGADVHP